jgi:3-hydroxyisobutyrate dehydrogenase-like beta-hydroxyacid dehydrogenase
MTIHTVALIGFGEVSRVLATDLPSHLTVTVFDTQPAKLDMPGRATACGSAAEAVRDADLVISAVTAAQTLAAAQSVQSGLKAGAWYMDLNSASPAAKIEACKAITSVTGRYVEVAVMSPIEPKRLTSPMLLGGLHAQDFAPVIQALGFTGASFYSDVPGKASATKLCRSVMIKGLEALISESLLSARYYGVEDTVLESLNNLFPHPDWPGYARYMISRTLEHGRRRAEEMEEAARTVAGAGLMPWMAQATVQRQGWAPDYADALAQDDLKTMLDAIRQQLTQKDAAE